MKFTKYEAAGNSYIIVNQDNFQLTSATAVKCCNPIYGAGGDGIICWKRKNRDAHNAYIWIETTIFNPDGSIAEKSGNGLRILATFLFENVFMTSRSLTFSTSGGNVVANRLLDQVDSLILLEMGRVICQIERKALSDSPIFEHGIKISTDVGPIIGRAVSIGNPHFVIFDDALSAERTKKIGPLVETHPTFPNRTNVQFIKIIDAQNISAEIWERGAGYTLSSGSSSCAIAAVAYQLGKCDSQVTVTMPGGQLKVEIKEDGNIWLSGPVNKTVEGVFKR